MIGNLISAPELLSPVNSLIFFVWSPVHVPLGHPDSQCSSRFFQVSVPKSQEFMPPCNTDPDNWNQRTVVLLAFSEMRIVQGRGCECKQRKAGPPDQKKSNIPVHNS